MIACIDCKSDFQRTNNNQKRCPDCAEEARAKSGRDRARKYAAAHPDRIRKAREKYLSKNRDAVNERERKRRAEDPQRYRESRKKFYWSNREAELERNAEWRSKNRNYNALRVAKYNSENREARSAYAARYNAENRESLRESNRRFAQENPGLRRAAEQRRKRRDASVDTSRSGLSWTAAEDAVVTSWTEGLRELGAVLSRSPRAVGQRRRDLRKRAAEQATNTKEVNP